MIITKFIFRLKRIIKSYLLNKLKKDYILKNLNIDLLNKSQKRVLISYVSVDCLNIIQSGFHTQLQEFLELLNYFVKNKYVIDIVPYYFDCFSKLSPSYDVVLGFGLPFNYVKLRNPNAISILYLTENPPSVSFMLENERISYFYERHHKHYPIERSGKCFLDSDLQNNSSIIYMCSPKYMLSYDGFYLNPTGFFNSSFELDFKNKQINNFIWLGGPAVIHKGLDLLIDVFNLHPEWTLFVCGVNKKKIKSMGLRCKYSNIIFMGFVDVLSSDFINIVNKSFYMLFPSCSEGTPTSCLTAMRYGMIPVVNKGSVYIESDNLVEYFVDYHLSALESKIKEITEGKTFSDCCELSLKIYSYSNSHFTLKNFRSNVSSILDNILN